MTGVNKENHNTEKIGPEFGPGPFCTLISKESNQINTSYRKEKDHIGRDILIDAKRNVT